ncbi:MAG: DUF3179 domain-containing protein [Trueperaceae bacterium]|nr:MAG: DUF3179 domain-containing protein [Trueperaceae bacterium]
MAPTEVVCAIGKSARDTAQRTCTARQILCIDESDRFYRQSKPALLGQATSGLLAGAQLEAVVHYNTMWFAWIAFHPLSEVYRQVVSQVR